MSACHYVSRIAISATSCFVVIALAGCAGGQGGNGLPANLESIIGAATKDASSRTNVDQGAIEVVRAEPVTWSDGSLGCPAPGMLYAQVLVPGYRIVLRASGQLLDYHAAANGNLALCPSEHAIEPAVDDRT